MDTVKEKSDTLIGFAVKARKVIYGADVIEKNKGMFLIICCPNLSDNGKKRMMALKTDKRNVLIAKKPLEDIVFRSGVKAIAITDKQLAHAIALVL